MQVLDMENLQWHEVLTPQQVILRTMLTIIAHIANVTVNINMHFCKKKDGSTVRTISSTSRSLSCILLIAFVRT